jgi:hypothetical protein
MRRLSVHVRANVVAYLALFVALGGTSYAAVVVGPNSVGNAQLKNHSITPVKFDPSKIGASVRFWAVVSASGHILAARPRTARIEHWDSADAHGIVTWREAIAPDCFPIGSILQEGAASGTANAGFINLSEGSGNASHAFVAFATYDAMGNHTPETAAVTVLCPQP